MLTMSTPRKRKKPTRSGSQIATYVDEEIRKAMEQYIEDFNTKNPHPATVRSTVEASLKAFLKAAGFYPPKA